MSSEIDFDELDQALKRCGSSWSAAQAHGLLSSRLAVVGQNAGFGWLDMVLEGTDPHNVLRSECESLLSDLYSNTGRALSERQSAFTPLLPDDAADAESRAEALGLWCEGYLHGLVSGEHVETLKERLAAEPISDIIRDMLEITRATAGEVDEEEADDAYIELVEYLRVAAQLVFEELADMREPAGAGDDSVH